MKKTFNLKLPVNVANQHTFFFPLLAIVFGAIYYKETTCILYQSKIHPPLKFTTKFSPSLIGEN